MQVDQEQAQLLINAFHDQLTFVCYAISKLRYSCIVLHSFSKKNRIKTGLN